MDTHMTRGAVAIPWIGHIVGRRLKGNSVRLPPKAACAVVTFQANNRDDRATEEPGVSRAVRGVASFTPVDPNGSMFESEWAPFLGMAFQACLFVLKRRINHMRTAAHLPDRRVGAVRIVAIRTSHEPLVHPVLKRLGELGFYVIVAAITDIGLSLGQQSAIRLRLVNGMTGSTNNICLGVGTTADVRAIGVLGVASQTGIECLVRGEFRERDYALFSTLCINVLASRSMAALTSGIVWRRIFGNQGFVVRIAEKLKGHIRMAGSTDHAATETGVSARRFRSSRLGIDWAGTQEPEHGENKQVRAK